MKVLRIAKEAFRNIISNKLRSVLTMLGLIIGIASVIVLVGISNGSSKQILSQIKSLGTDIVTVRIIDRQKALSYGDLSEILALEGVKSASAYKYINAKASKSKTVLKNSSILATDANYLEIRNLKLEFGRNLYKIDMDNKTKLCVIGYEVNQNLFGGQNSVGESFKIDGDEYKVIGILEKQGSAMGTNLENIILLPISVSEYLGSDTQIEELYVQVENEDNVDKVIQILKNYVIAKLQIAEENCSVTSESKSLEAMSNVNNTFSMLLAGIASISLIVGGIGVMNVMLVSVTERTKEVGIRKALGAQKKDILFQFLVEALVLCLIGGILGVTIGIIAGNLAQLLDYAFEYSSNIIMISFIMSMLIGIIFGIFPAYKASNLNPIDALRQE